MLKKIEYGYGLVKALVILGVVPVAIYSHGFAPSLDMELDHHEVLKSYEDKKKESDRSSSQDYATYYGWNDSSDSFGAQQPNEPDNSGNSPW